MAYRRRRMYRRKSRRATGRKSLVKKVNWLVRKEKKEVNQSKSIYFQANTYSTTLTYSSPMVTFLNPLIKGTGHLGERIGDMAKFSYLTLNVNIHRTTLSAVEPRLYRVLVIKETSSLGSMLSLSGYFNSATPYVIDVKNVSNRDKRRYQTYYDRTFLVGPNANVTGGIANPVHLNSTGSPDISIRIRKKLSFTTSYARGNSGGISDVDTNGLFLVVITDNQVANTSVDLAMILTYNDQ